MKLTLTYRSGTRAGQSLSFDSGRVVLGRDESCAVVFDLQEAMVSRQHAEIICDGANWQLNHLSQTNQTIINGSPVRQATLRSGDVLMLGSNGPTVSVMLEGELAATVAATPQQLGLPVPPTTPAYQPPAPAPAAPPPPTYQPPPGSYSPPMGAPPSLPYGAAPGMPPAAARKGSGGKIALILVGGSVVLLLLAGAVVVVVLMLQPKTLFSDDFSSKKSGWKLVMDKEKGNIEFGGNKLKMTASPVPSLASVTENLFGGKSGGSPGIAGCWYTEKSFGDFDCRIQTKQTKGGIAPHGLIFRLKEDGNTGSGYWFLISNNGNYGLFRLGSNYEKLVDWTSNSAIKTGSDDENTLRVVAKGSKIKLYVNDKLLKTVTDDSGNSSGNVGTVIVALKNESTVNFSRLEVLEAEKD